MKSVPSRSFALKVSDHNHGFKVGKVALIPLLGDIQEVEADAIAQPAGIPRKEWRSDDRKWIDVLAEWVRKTDRDNGSIKNALTKHEPFTLSDLVVTSAGRLRAKYIIARVRD